MIQVEKDIPIPGSKKKYPFDTMEIGDSFFVPFLSDEDPKKLAQSVYQCSQREKPKRFSVRTLREGVRCWRVPDNPSPTQKHQRSESKSTSKKKDSK